MKEEARNPETYAFTNVPPEFNTFGIHTEFQNKTCEVAQKRKSETVDGIPKKLKPIVTIALRLQLNLKKWRWGCCAKSISTAAQANAPKAQGRLIHAQTSYRQQMNFLIRSFELLSWVLCVLTLLLKTKNIFIYGSSERVRSAESSCAPTLRKKIVV